MEMKICRFTKFCVLNDTYPSSNFVFQYEFQNSNYIFSPRSGVHYVESFNSSVVATLWKDKETSVKHLLSVHITGVA